MPALALLRRSLPRGVTRWRIGIGIASLGLVTALAASAASEGERDVAAREFLAGFLDLTAADLRSLDQHRVVARTLETEDDREVATLGAVRVAVSAQQYVEQLRNIEAFKGQADAVLAIGRFSSPAADRDVDRLSLDPRELDGLQHCTRGHCVVQLSVEAMDAIRAHVARSAANARDLAATEFRRALVAMVDAYRASGDTALMTYADSSKPVSAAAEFRAMVDAPPAILRRFPEMFRHVVDYPRGPQDGIDDVIYWSKERLGPADVISVTHMAIAILPDVPVHAYAAVSRQIYGSRYFDASLGLTVVLDAEPDQRSAFVVYVNRSRIDALGGFWGGLKRRVVRSRARAAVATTLAAARDASERHFRER